MKVVKTKYEGVQDLQLYSNLVLQSKPKSTINKFGKSDMIVEDVQNEDLGGQEMELNKTKDLN